MKYKNKLTGEIVEYDSFMGMYYSKDVYHPYLKFELEQDNNWEEYE